VMGRFPKRVRAIYIRSVSRKPARLLALERLAAEVARGGSELVLAADAEAAAAHAAAAGLIRPYDLRSVRSDRDADETSAAKA
jgi:phosphatidate phosphatase APP1